MKRLFIGVPIQSEKATQIASAWQSNPLLNLNRMAWTKPANWHITLVFLGACPEAVVSQLIQLIDESFSLTLTFSSSLSGIGVFPKKSKPNVLWIGLDNSQPLLPGYQKLLDLLLKNDFVFDSKPLKPHLTVARIKSLGNRASFDALLGEYQQFNFGKVDINRVTLFESVSTSQGVVYEPLYEKKLLATDF